MKTTIGNVRSIDVKFKNQDGGRNMREEDVSMIEIVKSKELGDVQFVRYFLSLGELKKEIIPIVLFQTYSFFKALNQGEELDYLYASADGQVEKILITGKSSTEVIANFVFDFTPNVKQPIKKVEIVGSKGMYQLDTTAEVNFYSDVVGNQIKFDFSDPSEEAQQFFNKIKTSISQNQKVLLGGGQ